MRVCSACQIGNQKNFSNSVQDSPPTFLAGFIKSASLNADSNGNTAVAKSCFRLTSDSTLFTVASLMDILEKSSAVTVRAIPTDLWRQLKIKAAIDGDTVQVAVKKALERYVEAA